MFRHRCPDKEEMKRLINTIELMSAELDYEHKRRLLSEMRLKLAIDFEEFFKGQGDSNGL